MAKAFYLARGKEAAEAAKDNAENSRMGAMFGWCRQKLLLQIAWLSGNDVLKSSS